MFRPTPWFAALAAACAAAPDSVPVPPSDAAPRAACDPATAAKDAAALEAMAADEAARGEPLAAVRLLLDAEAARPDDVPLLEALVRTASTERLLPLALLHLRERPDALGRWFTGRVRYLLAIDRAADRALAELDAASADFAAAADLEPAWRDGSEQWIAMCIGAKGNAAFANGDFAAAEQWLLEAARLRPDRVREDLGRGDSVKLGLLRLGDRLMRDFARTERLFRTAAEYVDDDVDLFNNAAVYARDRGTQLERDGDAAGARAMFERSYAAYGRALGLAPHDVRLRNDCALVAIHHLRGDWDRARQLLLDAIADGERTLREDPPARPRERLDLDEAIGDCYENLALGWLQHGDAAAARAAAQASLTHHPGELRAGAQRHLRAAGAKAAGG